MNVRSTTVCVASLFFAGSVAVACGGGDDDGAGSTTTDGGASTASDGGTVSSNGNTVNGTVHAQSLVAKSAVAAYSIFSTNTVTAPDGGVTTTSTQGFALNIADKVDTCTDVHLAGSHILSLAMPGNPIAPGTFTVIDANAATPVAGQAEADFDATDATCSQAGFGETAKSGTVTITTIDSSSVVGTFDVTFADGHVTGSFDATICGQTELADAGNSCNP